MLKYSVLLLCSFLVRASLYPSLHLAIEALIRAQPSRHFRIQLEQVNSSLVFRPKLSEPLVFKYKNIINSVRHPADVLLFLFYDHVVSSTTRKRSALVPDDNLPEHILHDWEFVLKVFGGTIRNLYELQRSACDKDSSDNASDNDDENDYAESDDYETDFTPPICSLHLSVLEVFFSGLQPGSSHQIALRVARAINDYYFDRHGTPLPAQIAQILANQDI